MADYHKLTVVQIRELFKTRNIPTTGLTRKQQLIDRLLEEDAAAAPEDAADDTDAGAVREAADDAPEASSNNAVANDAQSLENAPPDLVPQPKESTVLDGDVPDNNTPADLSMPDKQQESAFPDAEQKQTEADQTQTHGTGSKSTTASPPPPEESRKRKRRSVSPPISEEEVLQKKAKQKEEGVAVVLKEDLQALDIPKQAPTAATGSAEESDSKGAASSSEIKDAPAIEVSEQLPEAPAPNEPSEKDKSETKTTPEPSEAQVPGTEEAKIDGAAASTQGSPFAPTKLPAGREKLYKDLVSAPPDTSGPSTIDEAEEVQQLGEERDITPALHPATTALYIRDFMRPLRPEALEAHLKSLARKHTASPEETEETVRSFHLDTIRTHCFVVFSSVSAASRVRSAIHERVWPAEGNRKPLWADFVPEDKVQGWIETEKDAGATMRGAGNKRWEVAYDRLEDGTVQTTLEEASAAPHGPRRPAAAQAPNAPAAVAGPGPAGQARREPSAVNAEVKQAQAPASFAALDSLFKSTSAKPKLYFMPVSKERAEKRLDELDALTSKHNVIPPGGSGYADSRRYTFENGDVLVDNGPEFGLRQMRPPPRAYRGGR